MITGFIARSAEGKRCALILDGRRRHADAIVITTSYPEPAYAVATRNWHPTPRAPRFSVAFEEGGQALVIPLATWTWVQRPSGRVLILATSEG